MDKTHVVVRRFAGRGLPPAHVQRNGKHEAGLPVADGEYTYDLVVRDKGGRIVDSPLRRITISTVGPQGDVPVSTNPQRARAGSSATIGRATTWATDSYPPSDSGGPRVVMLQGSRAILMQPFAF